MGGSRTLASSVSAFLTWLALRVKPRTVAWYKPYLDRFTARLGPDVPLHTVRQLDVESFTAQRHALIAICRFFRWCKKTAKFLKKNPTSAIEIPKGRRRCRTLTRRERITLRWLARRDRRRRPLALAMLTMEQTACRPGEHRALCWESLRALDGSHQPSDDALRSGTTYFELHDYKGKDRRRDASAGPRIITVPQRLGRLLIRLRSQSIDRPAGHVFRSLKGRAWTPNGFRCAWRRLRAVVAGLGVVEPRGLVPYLYRHSKATDLARAGYNSRVIADYLGHAGLAMVSVYVHSTKTDMTAIAAEYVERPAYEVKKKAAGESPAAQ